MGRAKLPRKSTNIDMTAMCDVAFLLLSFFILAAKFKPPEALKVTTPNSVYTKMVPEHNVLMITIDKAGKVYLSVSDNNSAEKQEIINTINSQKNLGLTDQEKGFFSRLPTSYIGVPFSQLKPFLDKMGVPDGLKDVVVGGIPVKDTLNNELIEWVRAAMTAFANSGTPMKVVIRGDNEAKYPSFQGVISAFKKNDLLKFQLVTSPVSIPTGTELWKANQNGTAKGVS
ncbi:MAG TPA: biopolymer transporter ExbD [Puia sp.]|nr:biopolymer transporter ExbD [Puia sp.]